MNVINSLVKMFDISNIRFKKKEKKKQSVIKDLLECPDQYKLEMYVKDEEIIIKIHKIEEV